jgi:hypothetical protein
MRHGEIQLPIDMTEARFQENSPIEESTPGNILEVVELVSVPISGPMVEVNPKIRTLVHVPHLIQTHG